MEPSLVSYVNYTPFAVSSGLSDLQNADSLVRDNYPKTGYSHPADSCLRNKEYLSSTYNFPTMMSQLPDDRIFQANTEKNVQMTLAKVKVK